MVNIKDFRFHSFEPRRIFDWTTICYLVLIGTIVAIQCAFILAGRPALRGDVITPLHDILAAVLPSMFS